MQRLTSLLLHALLLAAVCAVGAFWAIRVLTPPPTPAPPPIAAPVPREPDPVLAARMFGLVQAPQQRIAVNVQVSGVFAAGADSSAVLVVDGKAPRVYLVGQEVAPGTRLVEVGADAVVIESAAGRQELRVPQRPVVSFSDVPGPRAYVLEGNTLSAAPAAGVPAPSQPVRPQFAPGSAPVRPVPGPQRDDHDPSGPAPVVPPPPGQPMQPMPPGQPLPMPGQ